MSRRLPRRWNHLKKMTRKIKLKRTTNQRSLMIKLLLRMKRNLQRTLREKIQRRKLQKTCTTVMRMGKKRAVMKKAKVLKSDLINTEL